VDGIGRIKTAAYRKENYLVHPGYPVSIFLATLHLCVFALSFSFLAPHRGVAIFGVESDSEGDGVDLVVMRPKRERARFVDEFVVPWPSY